MPYQYAGGDEAGDTGFRFEQGSTSLILISLLFTDDLSAIEKSIRHLRSQLGIANHKEFRFHSMPQDHRLVFLSTLATCDLAVRILFVNKRNLPVVFRRMKSWDFYAFFVCALLDRVPAGELGGTILHLDDFGSRKVTLRALRRQMKQIGLTTLETKLLKRIVFKRSRGDMLIQAADMVAGSAYRWLSKGDRTYFDLVQSKVLVWEYRPGRNLPT